MAVVGRIVALRCKRRAWLALGAAVSVVGLAGATGPALAQASCLEFVPGAMTCAAEYHVRLAPGVGAYSARPSGYTIGDVAISGVTIKKSSKEAVKRARGCVSLVQQTKTYLGDSCGLTGTENNGALSDHGYLFLLGVAAPYAGTNALVQNTGAKEAEFTVWEYSTTEVEAELARQKGETEPMYVWEGCKAYWYCYQ
jgi:hypothetical protein